MKEPRTSEERMYERVRRTSRAFYLSLRFLPKPVRPTIALAYALARTADSIADVSNLDPAAKRPLLAPFLELASFARDESRADSLAREASLRVDRADERELILGLSENLLLYRELPPADRDSIDRVLAVLVEGMLLDLEWFAAGTKEEPVALEDMQALDRYTYHVAGVVGEFWSDVLEAHLPGWRRAPLERMRESGIRFGKGLQLTNVLRDLPRDLAIGRCYLPSRELSRLGLAPRDLLRPESEERVRPLLESILSSALGHFRHGFAYTLAIAPPGMRLRFSCALPLVIGTETLGLIRESKSLLDPRVVLKISRRRVYELAVRVGVGSPIHSLLEGAFRDSLRRAGFVPPG